MSDIFSGDSEHICIKNGKQKTINTIATLVVNVCDNRWITKWSSFA